MKKKKKKDDMDNNVVQLECSNNKYYTSIFRYIYIYDITNLLKKKIQ